MKRLLMASLVCTLFTGCASTQTANGGPSYGAKLLCANGLCSQEVVDWKNKKMLESARSECIQFGFRVNSPQFSQCLQNQINSAKNREMAESNARRVAESNSRPSQFSCSRVGSFVNCTEN